MALAVNNIIAEVRVDLDEPAPGVWTNTGLIGWLNDGVVRIASALRSIRDDWLTVRMTSQDSSLTLNGQSYAPSSLQLVSGTSIYTLPPDLVEIRRILPALDADKDDGIQFVPRDMSSPEWNWFDRETNPSENQQIFFFDIFGVNQIEFVPTPQKTIEIELYYVRFNRRYTFGDSITILPETASEAIKAYITYRAFRSIDHPSTSNQFAIFNEAVDALQSFSRPRQSHAITVVDDAFAEDLQGWYPHSFDPIS